MGHHIGLEEQDSRDYSRPLDPGMVVTIEPKIYLAEKQIAIMVAVTATGHDNLSAGSPKICGDVGYVLHEHALACCFGSDLGIAT